MIYKSHYLEIYINGNLLELEGQESLNLRLNNTLFEPTEIGSSQAEYSYSFSIPSTKNNDKIFDYANDLAKTDKFHQRRAAEVYADGHLIFSGTLLVNGFKDNQYQCNLVSVKVYSLEDIFGEAKLTDIPWYEPFDGFSTINAYNASGNKGVMFPLISYGVFQKSPSYSDEVANDYTPKHDIDKYNKWWLESFYPSLNMLETVKRAFKWKGYNIGGDAFTDSNLSDIYMSTNLANEQYPVYNLANPRIGEIDVHVDFTTLGSDTYTQELKYPYYHVKNGRAGFYAGDSVQINTKTYEAYNFEEIELYDLFDAGTTTFNADTYMFDPGEKCIVIPADGWYKIDMAVTTTLATSPSTFTAAQNIITDGGNGDDIEYVDISGITKNLYETCPIEIQLVRNYQDNIELIKGKWNKQYSNGNCTQTSYQQIQNKYVENVNEWQTCFPHEDPYQSGLPTKQNDLMLRNTTSVYQGNAEFGTTEVSNRGGSRSSRGNNRTTSSGSVRSYGVGEYGYVYKDGEIMAFDPAVSDNFICGFSSMGTATHSGARAVLKNGYSWSHSYSTPHYGFYEEPGYLKLSRNPNNTVTVDEVDTNFNANQYNDIPQSYFYSTSNNMAGNLSCMVWLNRNDILELFEIHRAYERENGVAVHYGSTTKVDLKITAASPRSYDMLKSIGYGYTSDSEFDYDLRITNFVNQDTQLSTWIQSVIDAFNLEVTQSGKNIWFNRKKSVVNNLPAVVNLDDRANSDDAETSNIEYPSSMAIKYNINTEEYGYWLTIPEEYRNEENWKDYGNSGYTVIKLSDDDYNVESDEKSVNFSYTWYDNFVWKEVDSGGTENSATTLTLSTPVISEYTYMAEGYSYDESMKHDGYGLTQRFWFKPKKTDAFIWSSSYPTEKADIYVPSNANNLLNLSYKTNEVSLLTRYFNLRPYLSSNYVTIEVYLTPDEYIAIKNGGNVTFDTELYSVVEINGFDPTGANPAELRLIKLV